ncbi:hypothetical protein ACFQXA_18365 [Nocardiopsis composta]
MAVDRPSDPERLPCGRLLDEVVEHALAGRPTGHERGCPHCRAVAERYRPWPGPDPSSPRSAPNRRRAWWGR